MKLRRTISLAILIGVFLLPVVVQAQAPSPTPAPSPVRSLSDNIAAMSQRAGSLLPYINDEIVSKLIGWFELLAWVFGNCLAGFAMLRVMRENNGEGSDLYWWFGRLALFFVLSGTGLASINGRSCIGYEIANGNETGQQSVLQRLYLAQRDSFNDSYAKFQQNMFTVKVDGREEAVTPVPLGTESVLGILVDTDSTIQNFDQKADVSQWNIATMMTWLNFERALIEFGDLILVILGAALTLGLKLAIPFMLACIVDKNIANKTTYPFFYGVIALTLIWPSVSEVIRIVAYMWGNVAMAVGDSSPLYIWDYKTMRAITNPLLQPEYTVVQAALTGQVAATSGAATTQRMIIQAAAGFQKSATGSEVARSVRETNIGASREVSNIVSGAKRDLYMNAGNTSAAKTDQGVSLVNSMIPPEVPV